MPSSEQGNQVDEIQLWFARQLREFVAGAGGPSYRQLALGIDALGASLSKSTIERILNGRTHPKPEMVEQIVRAAHAYAGRPGEPDLGVWERHYDRLQERLIVLGQGSRTIANAVADEEGRIWPRRLGSIPGAVEAFQERLDPLVDRVAGSFILTGTGGVGKTQAAAEYIRGRLAAGDLDLAIWISAGARDTIVSGMAAAATDLTGASYQDPELMAHRLRTWLAGTRHRWCVVLDDLSDISHVRGLWPLPSARGITLATTRRQDDGLRGYGRRVEVGVFRRDQAVTFLRARLPADAGSDDDLAGLAHDLGFLPLALAQVSTYMCDRELDCRTFRARWADTRRRLADLIPEPSALPDDYPVGLDAALELSVVEADKLHPAGTARTVLQILSVLDPNGVPESVLRTPAATALMPSADEDLRRDAQRDGVRNLRRLNLLDIAVDDATAETRILRVHVLHQRSTAELMSAARRYEVAQTAAQALLDCWAAPPSGSALDRMLRANAFVLYRREPEALFTPEPHEVLFRMGRSLGEAGQAAAAVEHFRQIDARVHDGTTGGTSVLAFKSRGYLAWWLAQAGRHGEAADAFESLYADQAEVLDPEDPDLMQTRQSAAVWRGHSGDLDVARQQLEQLYLERIRIQGPHHRDTISNRNHLANFRSYCGDFQGAWELHDQALRETEARVGPDHPDTLRARATAMRHRGEMGEIQRAVEAYRALAEHLQGAVPGHPSTFSARHQLHEWVARSGQLDAAVAGMERLLADRLAALGPEHPHTLDSRLLLIRWRNRSGDRERALAEADALRRDLERTLGPDSVFARAIPAALEPW
ncbi:tetratricopeptide repeat protein [Micromonospora sp. WMMD714]|uniref:tetratricopeptide repeat protein n=1 Tax=Micromonospora sp. WMMD714 TaxID=3016097 RepID=UPI002499EED5|nr:tetratricopeptide repeat protein [Micromonospora sp. WMMD714]WFE65834.1 tetratricopeptide repeat protein [Micromonospora sp. WMMD714]